MWEISEGATKSLYAMKVVSPKYSGVIVCLTLYTKSTSTIHWQACICIYRYINILLSLYMHLWEHNDFFEMYGIACIHEFSITQ